MIYHPRKPKSALIAFMKSVEAVATAIMLGFVILTFWICAALAIAISGITPLGHM